MHSIARLGVQGLRSIREPGAVVKLRCRRKFLRVFPGGFDDERYLTQERSSKWEAHHRWDDLLGTSYFASLLLAREFSEIGARALRAISATHLLSSSEKMAVRAAVDNPDGAELFARSLYDFLHGHGEERGKFSQWCRVVATLPREKERVLTWPIVTAFGFVADPKKHICLTPKVAREAANEYEYDFQYNSHPDWETYSSYLKFSATLRHDLHDLSPRDQIDILSFIKVLGTANGT